MGGFVFVVGPSGAGKDTLLALARSQLGSDPRLLFAKRIVTRPASLAEDHDTLDEAAFDAVEREGRFALSWRAHGLRYAVPVATLDAVLKGQIVICNVSRQVVAAGRRELPNVAVVEVTAPPEVRLARLRERRRQEDGDLQVRLTRAAEFGDVSPDLAIENTRTPEAGAAELIAFLKRRSSLVVAAAHA